MSVGRNEVTMLVLNSRQYTFDEKKCILFRNADAGSSWNRTFSTLSILVRNGKASVATESNVANKENVRYLVWSMEILSSSNGAILLGIANHKQISNPHPYSAG